LLLISLDQVHDRDIEIGELLVVVAVNAANIVKDVRENIKNLVGGRLAHYEQLIESTVERALGQLEQKATEQGYDGVLGVKISHPHVVAGGVEVVVYGNGFRYTKQV
jgi:uncharacterized protein YbjQ (UPF0145 family)